jgi:hypothetical protein
MLLHGQTGSGAHPTPYTTGTGSFPVVKRPRTGVNHPPSSNAEVKEGDVLCLHWRSYGELTSYLECCMYASFHCYWTFMLRRLMTSDTLCSVTVFWGGVGGIRIRLQLRQEVVCLSFNFFLSESFC